MYTKKGILTGKQAFAAPSEGEHYYLRLLLVGVSESHSLANLLTIDNCGLAELDDLVEKFQMSQVILLGFMTITTLTFRRTMVLKLQIN